MNRNPTCSTQENAVACHYAHGYCLVVISGAKWSAQKFPVPGPHILCRKLVVFWSLWNAH